MIQKILEKQGGLRYNLEEGGGKLVTSSQDHFGGGGGIRIRLGGAWTQGMFNQCV